jgi:hypothetical protein
MGKCEGIYKVLIRRNDGKINNGLYGQIADSEKNENMGLKI